MSDRYQRAMEAVPAKGYGGNARDDEPCPDQCSGCGAWALTFLTDMGSLCMCCLGGLTISVKP